MVALYLHQGIGTEYGNRLAAAGFTSLQEPAGLERRGAAGEAASRGLARAGADAGPGEDVAADGCPRVDGSGNLRGPLNEDRSSGYVCTSQRAISQVSGRVTVPVVSASEGALIDHHQKESTMPMKNPPHPRPLGCGSIAWPLWADCPGSG